MKKCLYILFFVFLLCSCGNKKSEPESNDEQLYLSEVADTLTVDSVETQKSTDAIQEVPIKTTTPSRDRYQKNDNMRGFDPAFEDDTDDNGMTRYMEVNDDNGWD